MRRCRGGIGHSDILFLLLLRYQHETRAVVLFRARLLSLLRQDRFSTASCRVEKSPLWTGNAFGRETARCWDKRVERSRALPAKS